MNYFEHMANYIGSGTVRLPAVELTTNATSTGSPLTSEESARMEELAALGLPIVVKTMLEGSPASGVYSYGVSQGMHAFVAVGPSFSMILMKHPQYGWVFVMQ